MNIQTVAQNLRNTIANKEYMLQELSGMQANAIAKNIANDAVIRFLTINVDELKKILADVEQCILKEYEFDESDSEEVRNLIRMGR